MAPRWPLSIFEVAAIFWSVKAVLRETTRAFYFVELQSITPRTDEIERYFERVKRDFWWREGVLIGFAFTSPSRVPACSFGVSIAQCVPSDHGLCKPRGEGTCAASYV
jgi:hypothetical protein